MAGGVLNPASMKQALVEGAQRIPGVPMVEQGQGKMSLLHSMVRSFFALFIGPMQHLASVFNGWVPCRKFCKRMSPVRPWCLLLSTSATAPSCGHFVGSRCTLAPCRLCSMQPCLMAWASRVCP